MKVKVFKGANGLWYWHLVAANGRVVADGAEGYDSKANAWRGWGTVAKLIVERAGETPGT